MILIYINFSFSDEQNQVEKSKQFQQASASEVPPYVAIQTNVVKPGNIIYDSVKETKYQPQEVSFKKIKLGI
jgi:hypothetical protein